LNTVRSLSNLIMSLNVFSALSTYSYSEEENYLTESFVFLLRLLLDRLPDDGLLFLNQIIGPLPLHDITQPKLTVIRTQSSYELGRPDIEIKEAEDTLILIEIKHDSLIGCGQLEKYLKELRLSQCKNVQLVLLTRSRSSANETTLTSADYKHICWYDIYNWLEDLSNRDEVSQYFIHDFMKFLEEKNMNLKKVTWEYIHGVDDLLNLTGMMEVAAKEAMPGVAFKRTGGWSWRGFYLDSTYFFGFRFNRPLIIVFENNLGTNPTAKRELDLENTHFFALTKDEQFELIANFIKQVRTEVPTGNNKTEPSDEQLS
jgi:hypothetical protein